SMFRPKSSTVRVADAFRRSAGSRNAAHIMPRATRNSQLNVPAPCSSEPRSATTSGLGPHANTPDMAEQTPRLKFDALVHKAGTTGPERRLGYSRPGYGASATK